MRRDRRRYGRHTIRDSKHVAGPVLMVSREAWAGFVELV
ncbi:DUF397 domain-containing protein [Sphaerisporangium sp. NPDC051011]